MNNDTHTAIYEIDGKWYFWDEIEVNGCGPYDSKPIAEEALQKYCEILNKENE